MSLTNSVGKFIDEVLRNNDTDLITPLLYYELIELDYYVTIYSLNRNVATSSILKIHGILHSPR